jgi:IS5 family transposase
MVRRLCSWSDAEIEHSLADNLALRQFYRVDLQPAPGDTTLRR